MANIAAFYVGRHSAKSHTEHGENAFWRERGREYVHKLFAGIDRHASREHLRVLVTDTPDIAPAGVEVIPMPFKPGEAPGWWSKLAYFKPGLLTGRTLHLDLDNVVCGDLAPMLALTPKPIIMMHDLVYPGLPNGSTLLFEPEQLAYLYTEYVAKTRLVQKEFSKWPKASDQAYIANRVKARTHQDVPFFQALLPAGMCLNSRTELEYGLYAWTQASLVYGCWVPKPHEAHNAHAARFYAEHWRLNDETVP